SWMRFGTSTPENLRRSIFTPKKSVFASRTSRTPVRKRSSNHENETRSGNRPCFRRRSRQSILRETGVPIRYRHRERKLSGDTVYSSSFRDIGHLWQGGHVCQGWLGRAGPRRG